jgi:hypothetical protein
MELALAVLLVAVLVVLYILFMTRRTPELVTTDQPKPSSSYEQKTNHFPRPSYEMGPIQGSESPFQVNQWLSYQV